MRARNSMNPNVKSKLQRLFQTNISVTEYSCSTKILLFYVFLHHVRDLLLIFFNLSKGKLNNSGSG